ncbi:hypothetical protein [Streptomyces sp. HB132]|uniref:hypothetical protein n=1 Tax=Streptomyces sp. HB132 TaxID=767388 RepID=UPI00195F27A8|nr:hypothetical protein [Streptomyces sp. HB132]MBM7443041.1 hypothetical protein [Streptomyces sp. HB132]
MTDEASRPDTLRVVDLIVAKGPKGAEDIMIAGLTVQVAAGETVVVQADDRASAEALIQVLAGRRRAQYGVIAVGDRGRPRPVAPAPPKGVTIVRPEQPLPAMGSRSAVVVDATRAGTNFADAAWAESVRTLARDGGGVLIVTTAAYPAHAAHRVIHLNRPPQPSARVEVQRSPSGGDA